MSFTSFTASARTIDHLGKGQIADTPTAISELWKNAYDAYARDVALHTFDGPIRCGAIIDNGCGMTLQQLKDSWLVIGTNAKTKKQQLPDSDRFNLPIRRTQGEKGIGRLSSAFLAPVTFLVTKKVDTTYSAALIDWRLFENPYLSLSDINIPIAEFADRDDISNVFSRLLDDLKVNISRPVSQNDADRSRIFSSWETFSLDELEKKIEPKTTLQKIDEFCSSFVFNKSLAKSWFELIDKFESKDGGKHGSALFLLDLNKELSILTNRESKALDDFHFLSIKESLIDTLRAFTDPFSKAKSNFSYDIKVFDTNQQERILLQSHEIFGIEDFNFLEHRVDGFINERGWFEGSITAFGVDMGVFRCPPSISFENGYSEVGRFSIKLGTFEYSKEKSSYDETRHQSVEKRISSLSGVYVFRDDLRVLPYGRTDNDFFEIEERRSISAGRHFWSNRRMIGHIALDQINNHKLKDKAGREGFIKNEAARELKKIVSDLLITLADQFFGAKSNARKDVLNILSKEKEARKLAQSKAKKQTQTSFKDALNKFTPDLESKLVLAKKLNEDLSRNVNISIDKIDELIKLTNQLESDRGVLKTPIKPPKLSAKLEDSYRKYRDMYSEFSEVLKVSRESINKLEINISSKSPHEIVKRNFDSKQSMLNAQISRYEKVIQSKVEELKLSWRAECSADRSSFYKEALPILDDVIEKNQLELKMNSLDSIYVNFSDSFTVKYDAILRTLERLEDGINLDAAFSMSEEEKDYFENKAKQLSSLAQLGISVEVMAHELEQQDMLVSRGLNSLPKEIKSHQGYITAYNAHKQLTDQIRFLSPLKLSGYQARQKITGKMIYSHISKFFGDRFERQRIDFVVSESFLKIEITDLPSRIYPVFINILNNALYWVCLAETRKVEIDVLDGFVVIGNSGPAIDDEDIDRLFEIFYSKRTGGNGVGLYLCKENLAAANHAIWYAQMSEQKLFIDGANFVIQFNGMESV